MKVMGLFSGKNMHYLLGGVVIGSASLVLAQTTIMNVVGNLDVNDDASVGGNLDVTGDTAVDDFKATGKSVFGTTDPASSYKVGIDVADGDDAIGLLIDYNDVTYEQYAFDIRYSANYGIVMHIDNDGAGDSIRDDSGAKLTAAGQWSDSSSRDVKENLVAVSDEEMLAKIKGIDLFMYNYVKEDDSVKNFGAMSEDWHEVFGLGKDDKSIACIAPGMISLRGIQALLVKIEEQERRIAALEEAVARSGGGEN